MWRWRRRGGSWRGGFPEAYPGRGGEVFPLLLAPTGSRVIVVEIDGPPFVHDRIIALGIVRGQELEIIKNNHLDFGLGPIIVRTSGMEIAVGRGMASYIMVKHEAK